MLAAESSFRAWRWTAVVLGSLGVWASIATAGTWVPVGGDQNAATVGNAAPRGARAVVERFDDNGLRVVVEVPGVELALEDTAGGEFLVVTWPEAPRFGQVGEPALPVVRRLFVAPQGSTIDLNVSPGATSLIDLRNVGLDNPVMPVHALPPVTDGDPEPPVFAFEPDAYAADDFAPAGRAEVVPAGLTRGWQLYLLEVRPVAYNPVRGALTVWPRIEVDISIQGQNRTNADLGRLDYLKGVLLNPPALPRTTREPGNFLIVAAQNFAASTPLTQFAADKTAQGFTVTIHSVFPGTTKYDIRTYIRDLWGTPDAPAYILLVGDAQDRADTSDPISIPIWSGYGVKAAPTDLYYACMDAGDDWYPDVPIGRWAVATVDELQNIVDKTIYVEAGVFDDPSFAERAVFLAGTDPNANAEALHNWIVDTYITPRDIQSNKVYMETYGAGTQDATDAFNSGCFLASLFGHGGYQAWTNGPPFTFTELDNLTNTGSYPFVAAFGCSTGQYWRTAFEPGWLEQWLRVPDKGAVAAYSTSVSLEPFWWPDWGNLYKFLFRSIYEDGNRELGPACHGALGHLLAFYGASEPVVRDFSEAFNLQGDPSLRLAQPPQKNYLIVVPPDYAGTPPMTQFAGAKTAQGFNVMSYAVPAGTSRTTIKAYIQSLWGTADAPDYILIVGDTSGATSTSATIPHWVGGGTRNATTDLPYACMDAGDDWYPEVPIGRFSVSTLTELQNVVNKSLLVEAGDFIDPTYVKRAAFLATSDSLAQANQIHDAMINSYLTPAGYTCSKIYANQGGGTQDIADAVNAGSLFTVYMGHSSSSGWWGPSFEQSNVNALTNNGLYGLVMGWSCNTSHFDYAECFGETWLRKENAGAAAYLSASNYIWWSSVDDWESSRRMEQYFFQSLFEDGIWRVGPAWKAACYRLLADPDYGPTHEHTRNIFEEFVLLGDPALRLPQPVDFSLSATPDSQSICCPPDEQASYTIVVGQTGGFGDTITLQASGQPAGATVDFDVNAQQPPFTSIMTVANLTGAAPGQYDILVTGNAPPDQRTVQVSLHIATDLPGTVTLVSPTNGATDVGRYPTLTWQPLTEAAEYDLELALDSGFASVVYSATVPETSHQVTTPLDSLTEYFWHLQAVNGCGVSGFSSPFSFTTLAQTDYFTEQFTGGADSFDLDAFTLAFIPDGSGSFYHMCGWPVTRLPTDPAGGQPLTITEDSWGTVTLGAPAFVKLYGVTYTTFYVCDNGYITFTQGDNTYNETLDSHFSIPRIAAFFDDFTVASGEGVSWKQFFDRVAVTYEKVPEYGTSNRNTFQVEMFVNGQIHITWLGMEASDAIVGLSAGNGLPDDFTETDLSAAQSCFPEGACCVGQSCTVLSRDDCAGMFGAYQGDDTDCDPNPCLPYESACVIITEIVDGCLSGGCPKWIEITNTGLTDFAFIEGGVIVQMDGSSDVVVDADLSGVTIPAGASYVVNSNHAGVCTGAFPVTYGFQADVYTDATFGDGNDRYILTDTADGSNLLDIYGEFGVDGGAWAYGDGYAYRLSAVNCGCGPYFTPGEWFFGGPGSLDGESPELLLLNNTTPGTHTFDQACDPSHVPGDGDDDQDVDLDDYLLFFDCLTGPGVLPGPTQTTVQRCLDAFDLNADADVDLADFRDFQNLCIGG
ncbi:MAG TPA: C25 family cysteine peptidase [Phycisphaerae bacterium]|nr:C25 family cysteine peptidase [Phycisphaerae bacterium]